MSALSLDLNTLLVVTVANIVTLAVVSPAVMGPRLSPAARSARWSLVLYAGAWISMIASNLWPETLLDRLLSTLSVGGFAASNGYLFKALEHWLGPRRFTRTARALVVLIPLGYFALFDSYALRVGWANGLLAVQLSLLGTACLQPANRLRGTWRRVVALGVFAIALLTFGRGVLGAFTEAYPSFLTPHPWNVLAMLMTNLLPLMVNFAVLGGWHEEVDIALHEQAITDAMTGLFNRRGWAEVGQPLLAQAHRHDDSLALLMIDIDHFKRINDSHGHEAGDRALQALGRLLLANRRGNDVAARVGGEEFCLLLPGCTAESAARIDLQLRQQLPALSAQLGFALDYSSGLSTRRPGESLEQLMQRADTALYSAKTGGRGRLDIAA